MTILADTTSIFENMLIVVHVVVCLLLCLVVLMQRPKQEGLGAAFGGGMTDQAFGARTTDVLQKGTVYLASALFIVTLILSILVGSKSRDTLITEKNLENSKTVVDENPDKVNKILNDDPEEDDDSGEAETKPEGGADKVETEVKSEGSDEKPVVETPEDATKEDPKPAVKPAVGPKPAADSKPAVEPKPLVKPDTSVNVIE